MPEECDGCEHNEVAIFDDFEDNPYNCYKCKKNFCGDCDVYDGNQYGYICGCCMKGGN